MTCMIYKVVLISYFIVNNTKLLLIATVLWKLKSMSFQMSKSPLLSNLFASLQQELHLNIFYAYSPKLCTLRWQMKNKSRKSQVWVQSSSFYLTMRNRYNQSSLEDIPWHTVTPSTNPMLWLPLQQCKYFRHLNQVSMTQQLAQVSSFRLLF